MLCEKSCSELNETTEVCPNCNTDVQNTQLDMLEFAEIPIVEQVEAPEDQQLSKREARKCRKKQKSANLTTGQKGIRAFFKTLLCLIAFAVLIGGSIVALVYSGVLDIPAVEALIYGADTSSSDLNLLKEPTSERYVINPENIVYQNESKTLGYVNNIVLVFFYSYTTDEEIASVVDSINGTIVGRTAGVYRYQIQIEPLEYEELEALCKELGKNKVVKMAMIDSVYTMEISGF